MKTGSAIQMLKELGVTDQELDEHKDKLIERSDHEMIEQAKAFKPYVMFPAKVKDGPCGVIERFVSARSEELHKAIGDSTVNNLFFQVFHTDVKKLSSRSHLTPIDNDDRRPIFLAATIGNPQQSMTYTAKNSHLFAASMNIHVDCYGGTEVIYRQSFGRSQHQLHAFLAWLSHTTGMVMPMWCTGWVLDHGTVDGNAHSSVATHTMEIAEFEAVLRGELEASAFIPAIDEVKAAEMADTDGNVVSFEEACRRSTRRAQLERLDVEAATRN